MKLLTNIYNVLQGGGIIVDGRKLLIAKAVSRQKATELTKKEEKVKEDKRNLHLVREGCKPLIQYVFGLLSRYFLLTMFKQLCLLLKQNEYFINK